MSTRTDWGYFDKQGQPLAVGDAHATWTCPNQEWERNGGEIHPYTGEWEASAPYPKLCPMKFVGAKLERCSTCGVEFRYP